MANHFTFFGSYSGVTRQCALCQELLVVNASSTDMDTRDAHHLWSSAFEKHILERHGSNRPVADADSCPATRIVV